MNVFLHQQYIGNLELIVQWYNKLKQTVLEVEYPLIETELRAIDDQLREAEEVFTWQKENCWRYIEQVKATVYDLEQRVQQSKENIKTIQQIMNAWAEHTLLARKDNRKDALLSLEDKEDRLAKKYKLLKEDGYRIHQLAEVISAIIIHRFYMIF